jgi:hypothetical protein
MILLPLTRIALNAKVLTLPPKRMPRLVPIINIPPLPLLLRKIVPIIIFTRQLLLSTRPSPQLKEIFEGMLHPSPWAPQGVGTKAFKPITNSRILKVVPRNQPPKASTLPLQQQRPMGPHLNSLPSLVHIFRWT